MTDARIEFDLAQLRAFAAVAGTGSFRGGAQALGVAQSTVSQQVVRLERAFGVRLFARTTRSVRITPQGRTLATYAHGILRLADDARRDLRPLPLDAAADGPAGRAEHRRRRGDGGDAVAGEGEGCHDGTPYRPVEAPPSGASPLDAQRKRRDGTSLGPPRDEPANPAIPNGPDCRRRT